MQPSLLFSYLFLSDVKAPVIPVDTNNGWSVFPVYYGTFMLSLRASRILVTERDPLEISDKKKVEAYLKKWTKNKTVTVLGVLNSADSHVFFQTFRLRRGKPVKLGKSGVIDGDLLLDRFTATQDIPDLKSLKKEQRKLLRAGMARRAINAK